MVADHVAHPPATCPTTRAQVCRRAPAPGGAVVQQPVYAPAAVPSRPRSDAATDHACSETLPKTDSEPGAVLGRRLALANPQHGRLCRVAQPPRLPAQEGQPCVQSTDVDVVARAVKQVRGGDLLYKCVNDAVKTGIGRGTTTGRPGQGPVAWVAIIGTPRRGPFRGTQRRGRGLSSRRSRGRGRAARTSPVQAPGRRARACPHPTTSGSPRACPRPAYE